MYLDSAPSTITRDLGLPIYTGNENGWLQQTCCHYWIKEQLDLVMTAHPQYTYTRTVLAGFHRSIDDSRKELVFEDYESAGQWILDRYEEHKNKMIKLVKNVGSK